jgi:endogenous inhibitor of DNA gyrase (YacG/DUF329 family)
MTGKESKPPARCRVCGKVIPAQRDTQGPFCSERCRLNDLSKWFGENYRIASSPMQRNESGEEHEES